MDIAKDPFQFAQLNFFALFLVQPVARERESGTSKRIETSKPTHESLLFFLH